MPATSIAEMPDNENFQKREAGTRRSLGGVLAALARVKEAEEEYRRSEAMYDRFR